MCLTLSPPELEPQVIDWCLHHKSILFPPRDPSRIRWKISKPLSKSLGAIPIRPACSSAYVWYARMGSCRIVICPEDTPGQFLPKHIRKLGSFSKHNRSRDFRRFCKQPLDKGSKLQVLKLAIDTTGAKQLYQDNSVVDYLVLTTLTRSQYWSKLCWKIGCLEMIPQRSRQTHQSLCPRTYWHICFKTLAWKFPPQRSRSFGTTHRSLIVLTGFCQLIGRMCR